MYDTLVLSGASSKGFLFLGALQNAYDNNLVGDIKYYVGTSVGAIICYLLVIGYKPYEILIYICTHHLLENMQEFNIMNIMNNEGVFSFRHIYEELEKMTIAKIGFFPTLLSLKEKFNKILICTTYNLTEDSTEILSYETHPDLPCLVALRMSANLPLVFENFKYGKHFYIDGGVANHFPMDIGCRYNQEDKKILGFVITEECKAANNSLEFIYKLMFIPISQTTNTILKTYSTEHTIVHLICKQVLFFNFNISTKDKLELFSSGYQQSKKFI
jgi:predicted acylesterase/phospholipase RssA